MILTIFPWKFTNKVLQQKMCPVLDCNFIISSLEQDSVLSYDIYSILSITAKFTKKCLRHLNSPAPQS